MTIGLTKKLACALPALVLAVTMGCASAQPIEAESAFVPQPSAGHPALVYNLDYRAASVLPVTQRPTESGVRYLLLGEEAYGQDAGTWDDWGGARDPQENDAAVTAAREFDEETMRLLQWQTSTVGTDKTRVLISERKRMVVFASEFGHEVLDDFVKKFHQERKRLLRANADRHLLEKKSVGWIAENDLNDAIKGASRDANGQLNLPVTVRISVAKADGSTSPEVVSLRPILVSKLQDAFLPSPKS